MKKDIRGIKDIPAFFLYPLYFLLTVIPLVVAEHFIKTPLSNYPWYPNEDQLDLFLYWKSVLIVLSGTVMACILLWRVPAWKQKKGSYNQHSLVLLFSPLIVYEGMAVLSSIFSPYSYYAVHGTVDQFEPLWVLLSYGIITFYAFIMVTEEPILKKVLLALFIGTCCIALIGMSQFVGLDFYRFLFRNRDYNFTFEPGRVYGTFYNPNYVGSYVALVLPLFLMLFVRARTIVCKAACGILSLLLTAILIGSRSATGFFICSFIFLLFLLFNRRKLAIARKLAFPAVGLVVLFAFLGRDYIKANYVDKLAYALKNMNQKTELSLEAISTNDNEVEIAYKGSILYVAFEVLNEEEGEYRFSVYDENKEAVANEVNEEEGSITLTDQRFPGFSLYPAISEELGGIAAFAVVIDGTVWYFTNQTDGTYYHITSVGKPDKIESHPSVQLINGRFASGRGYLWAKTVPLMAENWLLGTGPDSFTAAFPNADYVDAYNNNYKNQFVTRPHNLYLQIGTQTGMVSLLAVLLFYGVYAVKSLGLYWRREVKSLEEAAGLGIFLGTLGYMLVGMINDSSVTVAPLFWCLLGIGMAINQKMLKTDKIQ